MRYLSNMVSMFNRPSKRMVRLRPVVLLFVLLVFIHQAAPGQMTELQREHRMEELTEMAAQSAAEESGQSQQLIDMAELVTTPLKINKADEDELLRLNVFNYRQVRTILTYRKIYGPILTLKELSLTGDFSDDLLKKITPFVVFDTSPDSAVFRKERNWSQSFLFRMKTSFPEAKGFSSRSGSAPVYPGSPWSSYLRVRAGRGSALELGLTAENDAGEDFFRRTNQGGFDFYSGFMVWKGKSLLRKMLLGDYQLHVGQGISLWTGGGTGFSSDFFSMMRTGDGIRPYGSTGENRFFRGLAAEVGFGRFRLYTFYSGHKMDAFLVADSLGGRWIRSFPDDGLHRTTTELSKEKNVKEHMMGNYLDIRFDRCRIGFLGAWRRFGLPVEKSSEAYKFGSFEGRDNLNLGLDGQVILRSISLFGEVGMSENRKVAALCGLLYSPLPQFTLSILYRNYDPAFHPISGSAFSAGSDVHNEKGLFVAAEFNPVPKLRLKGETDLCYFPATTYQSISPAWCLSQTIRADYSPGRNLSFYFRYKRDARPRKESGATGIPGQEDAIVSGVRLHADCQVTTMIQLRSRLEHSGWRYNGQKESGYLIFQDIIFTPSVRLKCWFRLAWHHTDGYNSRIYSYENDLLYYFSIPEMHGAGLRSYLNVKYLAFRQLTLYAKAGYTLRSDAVAIGSGPDATDGNHRIDLRAQALIRF